MICSKPSNSTKHIYLTDHYLKKNEFNLKFKKYEFNISSTLSLLENTQKEIIVLKIVKMFSS